MTSLTIQNRFTGRRHRITGYAAGFYRLREISPEDRYTANVTAMPSLLLRILYRPIEPVTLARLYR